jgi:hypothetical protein
MRAVLMCVALASTAAGAAGCAHAAGREWGDAADVGVCAAERARDADKSAKPFVGVDKPTLFYERCAAASGDSEEISTYAHCHCMAACRSISNANGTPSGDDECLGKKCSEWRPVCSGRSAS